MFYVFLYVSRVVQDDGKNYLSYCMDATPSDNNGMSMFQTASVPYV